MVDKLHEKANLSQTEIRLCVLIFIGLDKQHILALLNYSDKGYGKLKYSASHKIGTTAKQMRKYMMHMLVNQGSSEVK